MKSYMSVLSGLILITCGMATANASFIVEADNVASPVGKANDHFTSTPPGTGFSLSATPSTAVGLAGNQSAFGNPADATGPDQYTFRYTPGTDVDNTTLTALASLGNSSAADVDGAGPLAPVYTNVPQLATGLTGGGSGLYNVYFTVPSSANVNPAGSLFEITSDLATIVLNPVILNDGGTGPDETAGTPYTGGANNRWLKLALVPLTAGNTYTVRLTANAATFTSQRAHGVMWEFVGVPEPSSLILAALTVVGLGMRRPSMA